jgi:hypothetical protein
LQCSGLISSDIPPNIEKLNEMRNIYERSRIRILGEVYKDPERKNVWIIARELISLFFYYRELPVHYVGRYLFKKDINNIKDFVPNKLSGLIAPKFNDQRLKQVLDNKLYFYLYYSQFGINLPVVIACNHGKLFASEGKASVIGGFNEFKDFLVDLFKNNTGCNALFLKKIYASSSGRNIHVLLIENMGKDDSKLKEIFQDVTASEYIFQPRVCQHHDLNRLNPSSLNTIRFDTFIDCEGNVEIISGFLKMSTNKLPVDNNTSGGCGVGINLDTGQLRKNGYSKIKMSGVGILTEHPVTGVKFENFVVPKIHEAQELVINAAKLMPGLRMVGWDVGITEDGPLLVEGNSDYGINSNDLMYGGYMTNPIFRKVLHEMKNNI